MIISNKNIKLQCFVTNRLHAFLDAKIFKNYIKINIVQNILLNATVTTVTICTNFLDDATVSGIV